MYHDQVSTHESQVKNLSCGDEVEVFIQIKDQEIVDISHRSRGCAISIASIDILCEYLLQKNISEIGLLDVKKIEELLGIPIGENRYKCAMLGIEAIKKAVKT